MEQCMSLCGKEALTVQGRWGWGSRWEGAHRGAQALADSGDALGTLHFGHRSAHVYKVCARARANTNLAGESVVQTPAKIFIQNCFMAHGSVCLCV